MNANNRNPWKAHRSVIEGRLIDETLLAQTHARLLDRLESGEGITWQEVIDAPAEAVWAAAAADVVSFYRHLPDVVDVHRLEHTPCERPRCVIERDHAGAQSVRVGEVLIDAEGSMICASDIDAADVSIAGPLPTLYSLSLHDHPTRRACTIVVLAGTTIGVYNPWILPALAHQCASIRQRLTSRGDYPLPARHSRRTRIQRPLAGPVAASGPGGHRG